MTSVFFCSIMEKRKKLEFMKWYWWIVIYLIIVFSINMFIKHLAKKNGCFDIMNSFSDKESKTEQNTILICIVVVLTLVLDYFKAFESYIITIIYFCFIFILAGVLPTLAKFLMALDKQQKGEYVDTSITGKEKDLRDTKESLYKLGLVMFIFSIFNNKRRK